MNEIKNVINEIIRKYGFPEVFLYKRNAVELLEKQILSCLNESNSQQIEWWILKFVNGKLYVYDHKINDWKLFFEVKNE
ncbi:MAG: hypothetical protein QW272_05110 [Candidatus Methanomethylicaceae archaeon]